MSIQQTAPAAAGVGIGAVAERIICGLHPVSHLLRNEPDRIEELFVQRQLGAERSARLQGLESFRGRRREIESAELDRLTGTAKHQGVAARVRAAEMLTEAAARDLVYALDSPLLLVLDGIQDPRNFGACLRTAEAAGVDLVVIGRSRNVGITPVVSKVAAGAAELQTIASVGNLARFLAFLGEAGVRVIGADGDADQSLYGQDLAGPLALVLGAEGQGLRRLTRERCDALVRLPMLGVVESLNVAVATGICLYEALRQRS